MVKFRLNGNRYVVVQKRVTGITGEKVVVDGVEYLIITSGLRQDERIIKPVTLTVGSRVINKYHKALKRLAE